MNRLLPVVFALTAAAWLNHAALGHSDEVGGRYNIPHFKEQKKLIFFTPFDQPLAQALQKSQEVGPFSLRTIKRLPSRYSLSNIEELTNQSPKPGTYCGRSLRIGKDPSTAASVYFPEFIRAAVEIKDIKLKGTFKAELRRFTPRSQDEDKSNQVRKFMTCEALVVPLTTKKIVK